MPAAMMELDADVGRKAKHRHHKKTRFQKRERREEVQEEKPYYDKVAGKMVLPSYVEEYISELKQKYPHYAVEVKPRKDGGLQKYAVLFNGNKDDGGRLLTAIEVKEATSALRA